MDNHLHKWHCFHDTKLICNDCKTVTDIKDLMANTESATAIKTKLEVLSKQLFAGELKKAAHDTAYAWVRQHNPEALPVKQGVLV